MADIVFILLVLVFFVAAAGFVLLCDRIIGPAADVSAVAPAPLSPVGTSTAEAA